MQLFEGFTAFRIAVNQLQKQIDDTAMQAGSEAYARARIVYTCAKRFGRKSCAAAESDSLPSPSTTRPLTAAIAT